MSKRVLIGLLAVSILAMCGSAANAFNRINGIIIRHRSVEVEVTLCGNPQQPTQLDLFLDGAGFLECWNPAGKLPPGTGHQTIPFILERSLEVSSDDFTTEVMCDSGNNNNATALIRTVFELELECKQKKFTKKSAVINVEVTATWRCLDSGPECPGGAATIEAVRTECLGLEVGDECNRQGEGALEHVGDEGQPPPPLTANAFFDFQQWVTDNDEQGFDNEYPFEITDNGLTLTATAFESEGTSHVYMDGFSPPSIGGMGACTNLDEGNQCFPASDDSASNGETLRWNFSHSITQVTLELGNGNHATYAFGAFRYQYGSQGWQTATTDKDGKITLIFDGSSAQLEFKTVTKPIFESEFFYIRNAAVTYLLEFGEL
jgi:hypothetical protein